MIKVLISVKYLLGKLKPINFDNEWVVAVRGEGSNLMIDTNKQTIEIYCDILEFAPRVTQEGRRWDWVVDLLQKTEDQPVVISITQKIVQIIFQY